VSPAGRVGRTAFEPTAKQATIPIQDLICAARHQLIKKEKHLEIKTIEIAGRCQGEGAKAKSQSISAGRTGFPPLPQ
jgi:hypothetical protein